MEAIQTIVVIVTILLLIMSIATINGASADNYIPPTGYRLNWKQMNYDSAMGTSKSEINRRILIGYYNIKADE